MATQESLDRVQQLYVAYYGRPADQEGQEYWADRLDAEGEGAIINAFGNSEEYAAKAEGQGNATLIDAIYQQAFNRKADPEGLAYYAGVLERGEKTLAEIATTIINAAGGIDAQTFNARVEAAAAYTAESGAAADYDLEAAIAAVEAAKPGVNASALTEALSTLNAAQDSVESFLEGARSNEALQENQNVESDTDVGTVRTAIGNEYTAAASGDAEVTGYDGADVSLSTFLNDAGFDGRSSTVQDALTSEAVADAEKTVSDFKTAIDAVDGLSLAVRTYNNAQEAQIAAGEALDDAQADTLGAITTFENRTGLTLTFSDGTNPVTVDGNQDITTVAEVTDGTNTLLTVANGEFVIEASAADVEGINTLQATLQSEYDAQVAADAAAQAVIDADAALDALDAEVAAEDFVKASDGTTPVDTGLGVANELAAREETLTDLTAAIERFENARSLSNELESLDEAVTDAESAITDSEADGGLGVDLFTSDDVAAGPPATLTVDAGDDVVLFSEELDGVEIQSFASSGEDRLFFGEGFELVELTEAWDATADTGDSAVQEIFWAEASGNLTLYVENKAFAGNASGADDITEIQLTGVSAADIEFSGGYLSAGEPA